MLKEVGIGQQPAVMVIDSEPSFRLLMCEVLDDIHCQSLVCSSSDDVVEQIRLSQPDLVLLDLWMDRPGKGEVILAQILSNPALQRMPVIAFTTDPMLAEREAHRVDPSRCVVLVKPFRLESLIVAMQHWLKVAPLGAV